MASSAPAEALVGAASPAFAAYRRGTQGAQPARVKQAMLRDLGSRDAEFIAVVAEVRRSTR